MVEHFYMTLCFNIESFLHSGPIDKDWYIAIKYIYLLLRIRNHCPSSPYTAYAYNHTSDQK